MGNPLSQLLVYQEIEEEKKDLRKLGLTEEEIVGYFDMFIEQFVEFSGEATP